MENTERTEKVGAKVERRRKRRGEEEEKISKR